MLLLSDVGNVSLTISVYQNRKELFNYRTYSDKLRSEEEYEATLQSFFQFNHLSGSDFEGAILSSVVPSLTIRIQKAASRTIGKECLILNRSLKTGLALRMDNPSEVGSDLIAAAVGAVNDYQKPCLVVLMNTCLSFIAVDGKKSFLGGALFPGLRFSANSMFSANAQLMDIDLEKPHRFIGKSTRESMNSGIVYGYTMLIQSYAEAMEKEFHAPMAKIITGADSAIVKDLLPLDYHYNPNVLFDGLYDIYMKNKGE